MPLMETPIYIYVGTDPHMRKGEVALEHSIRKYASRPIQIVWMNFAKGGIWANWDIGRSRGIPYSGTGWATDFTCFRFAIPEANNFEGRAIYLDVDMLLLRDINELFTLSMDKPVMVTPRGYDVMLYDCAAFKDKKWWPSIKDMKTNHWMINDYNKVLQEHGMISSNLPLIWNCLDGDGYDPEKTGLIHFTDMHTQPWKPYPDRFKYPPHPRPDMVELFWKYYEEAMKESAE